ncbi:MAG TPA: GxxExxY protein [Gammaproteobacteria bacterium]|jgi:GxxExxY protein
MDDKVTGKIIASALEVHTVLGHGLLEAVYKEALCHEFALRNIAPD